MTGPIHVIDADYRRRAHIARDLSTRHVHAEIYESLDEFCQSSPNGGFIFAADDTDTPAPAIAESLKARGATMPLVVYSEEPTTQQIVKAITCGALDYLEWPFESDSLKGVFRRMATEGEMQRERAQRRLEARRRIQQLTERESDVLTRLAFGMSNKEIAKALGISSRTVEIHRANMMNKLNALSAADAARLALYAGLDENY